MKIESVSNPDQVKSIVYRKSQSSTVAKASSTSTTEVATNNSNGTYTVDVTNENSEPQPANQNNFHFAKTGNSFKFDFQVTTTDNNVPSDNSTIQNDSVDNSEKGEGTIEPSVNFYKMEPSNEKFAFNFFNSENS